MNILFVETYQINHLEGSVKKISDQELSEDFQDYINSLILGIPREAGKRKFIFPSDTTEVNSSLIKYVNDQDDIDIGKICAERLLRVELNAQKRMDKLNIKILEGILFFAFIEINNKKSIILSKNDHSDYLDEKDFSRHAGLPIKKKLFKSFIGELSSDLNSFESIYISDTNSKISVYWWQDFLELSEVYTDEYNTKRTFSSIESAVFKKMKNSYPADHVVLRNSTVKAFRSEDEFNFDLYIVDVWNNYQPIDDDFPKNKYIETLKKLPEKKKFDTRFSIIKSEMKARLLTNTISLNEKIDLILKEDIDNLGSTIQAEQDPDGTKYIRIKTEKGYESFKRNE